jgi:hypothetical protein
MANAELRAKFGYLTYDDMLTKLSDGIFDAYDVIYTKDRKNQYIISEENEPIEIRSRIKVFDSASDALADINSSSDTYVGQIVSILDSDFYRGYSVNIDSLGAYKLVPLYENPEVVDYNDLANIPIINIRGEANEPIVLKELDNGIYRLKGFFITPDDSTDIKNTVVGNIILVENNLIKRITNNSIYDYLPIAGGDYIAEEYATKGYIEQQNFVTHPELEACDYVSNAELDVKIEALKVSLMADLEEYIDAVFETRVADIVNRTVDQKFENSQIPQEDIEELFE